MEFLQFLFIVLIVIDSKTGIINEHTNQTVQGKKNTNYN